VAARRTQPDGELTPLRMAKMAIANSQTTAIVSLMCLSAMEIQYRLGSAACCSGSHTLRLHVRMCNVAQTLWRSSVTIARRGSVI